MSFKIDFNFSGSAMYQIQAVLKVLPKRLRNGAMRSAGRKAAEVVKRTIRPLVPRSKKNYRVQGPFQRADTGRGGYMHLRDGVISVVRTYRDAVFMAVGPRSGAKLFHAHLVEFGTRDRYTRHTSRYRDVGTKRIKTRYKALSASGHPISKPGYKTKRIRRSIGSFLDERKAAKGPVQRRGRMPASLYMSRGWAAAEPRVYQVIQTELTNALANIGTIVTP